jgi:hypothetical protein
MFVQGVADHIWVKKMQQCINLKMAIILQSQSYIMTDSQSASMSGTHLGPVTSFSPPFLNYF